MLNGSIPDNKFLIFSKLASYTSRFMMKTEGKIYYFLKYSLHCLHIILINLTYLRTTLFTLNITLFTRNIKVKFYNKF